MCESKVQPLRLKEWLLQQIDSGCFPGLKWENPEKSLFRIPWKHAAKQDYSEQSDAALFKAWAMYKGKFREGSGKADPSVWKTRLRCALNKSPDFEEVLEGNNLDLSEPYKLYRVVHSEQGRNVGGNEDSLNVSVKSISVFCKDKIPEITKEQKSPVREQGEGCPRNTITRHNSEDEAPQEKGFQNPEIQQLSQRREQKRSASPELEMSKSTRRATTSSTPRTFLGTNLCSDYSVLDLSARKEVFPTSPSMSDFWLHVRLYYQDKLVTEVTTKTAEGCHIVSSSVSQQQLSLCPPLSLEVVSFPSPQDFPSIVSTDMGLVLQKLLKHLDRGLLLWVAPEGVFVKRQCQARVYWSGQMAPHSDQPNKLERDKTCKVLDTERFVHELQMYVAHGGPEPRHQIQLCFGEEYPDTSRVHPKILIMALVEPVFARELLLNSQNKLQKDVENQGHLCPGVKVCSVPHL